MIRTQALRYRYPQSRDMAFPDLACGAGEHLLLLGRSGIGKTTLLHLLAGLILPQEGEIWINGTDITNLSTTKLDKFRGQHIGLVFQRPHFMQALSVRENLLLAQHLAGLKQQEERVEELLFRLGLPGKSNRRVQELSLGEQQRIAIARALINTPGVIIADEPTSNLDDHHCLQVATLLEEQAQLEQAALLIVTHDQRLKDRFVNQVHL
ncbi:ABC transporter ATP-binding protein [Pontibacter sp. SGAir0037]|nr:ATP-binding cassette domain-containing protein [Pontibacter sp. SGAir0037]QCR24883.1 ABC transporter ATP-binding protein [Pontibacter sp. SGAir0037]